MFAVSYDIKNFFFDRPKVRALAGKKTAAALNRMAGFIRVTARRSMRSGGKKGKSSEPGVPPRYHTKDKVATLRNILYGYDPRTGGVIVGPVGLNQKQFYGGELKAGSVPALHEFGGSIGFREKQVGAVWRPVGRRKPGPGQATRVRNATYPARPYMRPALTKAIERFPEIWYGNNITADAA